MADTVNERHCDICLAEFATKQVVERHKQKRTKCTPHPDVIARMTADGLPIPPHTPNPHEAPCPYCGEVLSTGQSLARHLAKAKKCSENIPRNTPAVASHSTSDPQSPELTHWQCQCIICDELKASKQSLARHLSKTKKCTPTIPIPRDLKCGECAEAFLDVLAYCNHVKSQHPVLAAEQKRILVAGIVPEEPHTAQDFAMRAPGPKAREIRDMYIRVMALVMDYDKLSNLYDVQEAERLARHTAIVENTTLRSLLYISGLMWINGELRVKAGCTKETPKDRLKGLNPKFGMGKHRFLFHKVFFLANPHTVEREFKTNSKFAPYFSDVVLDNGSVSKETFRCDHATLDEICREMEKCAHRTGKQFEETAEDEREAIRQHEKCLKGWEHSVLMKTKQIEETVRIKELELQQAREVAEIERDTVIAKVELAKLELRGARAGL
ncbi:g806 [Coccomyxa elongata]